VNGWHETYNDYPGPDVVCGHLGTIAPRPALADATDACRDCLVEGTTWVELRRCLVCGQIRCCESSPRRHATAHFDQTGHAVMASQSGGEQWGWCYVDGMPLSPDKD
jgi:Zn-finger in ubiquitin-hydrolases and other protein